MKKVAVAGGAGYVGGELIRLLVHHPQLELSHVSSRSQAGKKISDVHRDLISLTELSFSNELPQDIDVLFVAMGHGKSRDYINSLTLSPDTVIIDMSRDYRLKDDAEGYIYGLCELNKSDISNAQYIANPGCFATCIQFALLPLAANNQLNAEVHVTAITGSTGAGQNPIATTHFSWRDSNISIYKPFTHQHLDEIHQSIKQLQPNFDQEINFIPMRGDFTRGIFASVYLDSHLDEDEVIALYKEYYKNSPFVHVSDAPISVKDAVNTNNGLLHISKHGSKLRIESAIDNLLKGAAGQAVQNLNLIMGWREDAGLRLKASAF